MIWHFPTATIAIATFRLKNRFYFPGIVFVRCVLPLLLLSLLLLSNFQGFDVVCVISFVVVVIIVTIVYPPLLYHTHFPFLTGLLIVDAYELYAFHSTYCVA